MKHFSIPPIMPENKNPIPNAKDIEVKPEEILNPTVIEKIPEERQIPTRTYYDPNDDGGLDDDKFEDLLYENFGGLFDNIFENSDDDIPNDNEGEGEGEVEVEGEGEGEGEGYENFGGLFDDIFENSDDVVEIENFDDGVPNCDEDDGDRPRRDAPDSEAKEEALPAVIEQIAPPPPVNITEWSTHLRFRASVLDVHYESFVTNTARNFILLKNYAAQYGTESLNYLVTNFEAEVRFLDDDFKRIANSNEDNLIIDAAAEAVVSKSRLLTRVTTAYAKAITCISDDQPIPEAFSIGPYNFDHKTILDLLKKPNGTVERRQPPENILGHIDWKNETPPRPEKLRTVPYPDDKARYEKARDEQFFNDLVNLTAWIPANESDEPNPFVHLYNWIKTWFG